MKIGYKYEGCALVSSTRDAMRLSMRAISDLSSCKQTSESIARKWLTPSMPYLDLVVDEPRAHLDVLCRHGIDLGIRAILSIHFELIRSIAHHKFGTHVDSHGLFERRHVYLKRASVWLSHNAVRGHGWAYNISVSFLFVD